MMSTVAKSSPGPVSNKSTIIIKEGRVAWWGVWAYHDCSGLTSGTSDVHGWRHRWHSDSPECIRPSAFNLSDSSRGLVADSHRKTY